MQSPIIKLISMMILKWGVNAGCISRWPLFHSRQLLTVMTQVLYTLSYSLPDANFLYGRDFRQIV